MRLLILTQKVDRKDPVLGFFHRWLEAFAEKFEEISVVALGTGEYALPENVKVYSLGKEEGVSKLAYLWNFYKYIWSLRNEYDAVFVHMNQEYVILGWKTWFFLGKPIYLWRNHAKGNLLTRFAVLVSKKVFCTSPESYTARFKKTILMPVGIDTDFFKPDIAVNRRTGSILFLGRISPVKRVVEFIEWLNDLKEGGQEFFATIAGGALPMDEKYAELVRNRVNERGLSGKVKFVGPVDQLGALKLYQLNETYVNFTPAGSMDKTILEAAACEAKVVVTNPALKILEGKNGPEAREFVIHNHSLKLLAEKLSQELIA